MIKPYLQTFAFFLIVVPTQLARLCDEQSEEAIHSFFIVYSSFLVNLNHSGSADVTYVNGPQG